MFTGIKENMPKNTKKNHSPNKLRILTLEIKKKSVPQKKECTSTATVTFLAKHNNLTPYIKSLKKTLFSPKYMRPKIELVRKLSALQ